jgi:intein/homing endonuclease
MPKIRMRLQLRRLPKAEGNLMPICPKCTTPDSIIAGDYKPIAEYNIGESCIGLTFTHVREVFKREFDGELVVIKGSGLLPVMLTPEHPVRVAEFVVQQRLSLKLKGLVWKNAEDIKPASRHKGGDYLLVPKIRGKLSPRRLNLKNFATPHGVLVAKKKHIPITISLTPSTSWLMGLYVAEGNSTEKGVCFSLGKHEINLKDKVIKIAKALGYSPCIVNKRTAIRVEVPSRILARAFKKWFGEHVYEKRIPPFILYHKNLEVLRAFLDGYLSGDGCKYLVLWKGEKGWKFSTVSKVLALQLQLLCLRLGFPTHITKVTPKETCVIEGRTVRQREIYQLRFSTGKGLNKRWRIMQDFACVPVVSVQRTPYKGNVYNLETGTGTYLINNVLTHNCHGAWLMQTDNPNRFICLSCKTEYELKPVEKQNRPQK